RCNEVDIRRQLGGVIGALVPLLPNFVLALPSLGSVEAKPDVECLTARDRDRDLTLHALDDVDQVVDFQFVAQDRFVTNHDRADVAVTLGKRDRLQDLLIIAAAAVLLAVVEPDTDGDLHTELGRDAGHELDTTGRRISAYRPRVGTEHSEIAADLLDR